MNSTGAAKPGRLETGASLAKSSFRVLKLDRKLLLLPVWSLLCSLLALIPFGIAAYFNTTVLSSGSNFIEANLELNYFTVPFYLSLLIVMTTIGNFFAGALIYGAVQRFQGQEPTIRSCLAATAQRWRALLGYSILMATVGYILNLLEQRLPLAGKIAVWLAGAAWSIANLFAIPLIMTSEKPLQPLEATRRSAALVRKTWGESVVSQLGIGIIGALSLLAWSALALGMASLGAIPPLPLGYFLIVGVLGLVGLLLIALIFNTLGAIARAAVFYYAQTGESPAEFDKRLIYQSMTPKKARKIFGT